MLAQSGERQRSGKRRLREGKRTAANRRSALRKCRNAVSAGVLSPISSAVGRNGAGGDKRNARAGGAAPAASRCCACGRKLVLRLRARDGEFRAPARVTFFCCQKKVTKENHLDLRSKDPLARGGQVQLWRCWLRGIGAVVITVGQKDCACVHRRGGFRDRLPQPR